MHALILSLRRLSLFIEVASKTTPFYVYSPPIVAIVGALVSTSLPPASFPQSQTKRKTAAYLGYGKGGGERGGVAKPDVHNSSLP